METQCVAELLRDVRHGFAPKINENVATQDEIEVVQSSQREIVVAQIAVSKRNHLAQTSVENPFFAAFLKVSVAHRVGRVAKRPRAVNTVLRLVQSGFA